MNDSVPTADELIQQCGDDAPRFAKEKAKILREHRRPGGREWQQLAHELETRQRAWWKHLHGAGS
jgi:hypothetical protein